MKRRDTMNKTLTARMGRLEHFQKLSETDLEEIIAAGRIQTIPAGATICREAEPCSGLFVLLAGRVHLHKLGPEGQDNIMAVLEPVTMFNEVAVLDGGDNAATAIAFRNSRLWSIDREGFQTLIEAHPAIALGMLPILAARNRLLVSKFEDLSFRTVKARTAKLLLELSENGRRTINRREYTIITLAAQICTVPEAISRAITFFREQGYIDSTRSKIVVRQPEALSGAAQIEATFLWRERA
jgi:CRP/FNR family transcriptional regulator